MTRVTWMPEPTDVLGWSRGSSPSRHSASVSSRGKTETIAAKTAFSFDVEPGRTQIPELVQESFVVANAGDRICSLAACRAEGSCADTVCAAGIADATSSHIPCQESEGEGSIQIWMLHERGGGTYQFEVAHEGAKTDALEWCPCRNYFSAVEGHGCSIDSRIGLLLAVCSNATVCVWAVPKLAETLQPPEPGQCALQIVWCIVLLHFTALDQKNSYQPCSRPCAHGPFG